MATERRESSNAQGQGNQHPASSNRNERELCQTSSYSIVVASQKLNEKGLHFSNLSEEQQNHLLFEQHQILSNIKQLENKAISSRTGSQEDQEENKVFLSNRMNT